MEHFATFFIPVIRRWIGNGYITFDETEQRYIIVNLFGPLAGGAIIVLKKFLTKIIPKSLQFFFSKEEIKKCENTMVSILFDALVDADIYKCFQTVIYYIREVIDFLKKILKTAANKVKEVLERGNEFTRNLAILGSDTVDPSSYSRQRDQNYRQNIYQDGYLRPDVILPQHKVNDNMINFNGNMSELTDKNLHLEQTRSVRHEFLKDRKIVTVTETKSMSLNVEPSQKNNGNFNTSSIVGSRSDDGSKFKGVMKKCYYHVGNVDVETSNKDILEYLDYYLPNSNFTCQRIHSNEHGQSFKIGVNFSVKNRLEFPSIWPKGVIVSSFQFKKKNAETNSLVPINKITTSNQTNGFQHEDNVKFTGESEIENTKFKGAEERCWYYVGRVIQGVSEKDLLEHMKKIIPRGKFTCKTLKSAGRTQSFKVSINSSVKTIVESTNFWPCGVIVRPFHHSNENKLPQIEANTIPKAITA